LDRYIPVPVASALYKTQNEEYLRLPKATTVRPDKNYPITYSVGNQIKNIVEVNPLSSIVQTDSAKSFILNYSKYNFPGWNASIDDKNVPIESGQPFGQITVSVPAGTHTVKIFFRETIINIVLDFLSLGTIIFCLTLIIRSKK
jgi:uncharacterized membrane protein YfhO